MFDRYASIVFMALGVALFFYAQTLTTSSTGGSIGPKELPLFLAVVLILFSLVNLVTALRAKAAPKQDGPAYRQFLVILGLLASLGLPEVAVQPPENAGAGRPVTAPSVTPTLAASDGPLFSISTA